MTYLVLVSAAFIAALYGTGLKYLLHNRFALLIPDVAFVLILGLLLTREAVEHRRIRRESVPLLVTICAYLSVGIIQMANPNVPSVLAGLEGFRKTCLYTSLALIGIYLQWSPRIATKFIRILSIAAVPLCLYAIKQFFAPSSFDFQIPEQNTAGEAVYNVFGAYRATSLFGSPFALGFIGDIVIAFGLYLAAVRTPAPWVWLVVCSGVAAIVVSLTRVSILAGAVLAVFAPVMILKTQGWFTRACAGLLLLVLGGVALSLTPVGEDVVRSLDLRYLDEDRAYGRFEGYSAGLAEVAKSPMVAYGTGSAGDGLDSYFAGSTYLASSHNVLLKIAFELGVAGLLAFLSFCAYWTRVAIRRYHDAGTRETRAIVGLAGCLFLAFIVQGTSGSGIDNFPGNGITFFLMGLIVGMPGSCANT